MENRIWYRLPNAIFGPNTTFFKREMEQYWIWEEQQSKVILIMKILFKYLDLEGYLIVP